MHYCNAGKAGIKVSEIALGSWMARPEGTDAYSGGDTEAFLGRFIKDIPREETVIFSKEFFPIGKSASGYDLSHEHIFNNRKLSLKNLGIDYIDPYYYHRFDTTMPMEETLQALSDLGESGQDPVLRRKRGMERGAHRTHLSERKLHPLTVIQSQYNRIDRYIEHEIVNTCDYYGIGITPFSPACAGSADR